MREPGTSAVLPAAPSVTGRQFARELARAAAAGGVYLLLRPVWEWTGLRELYRAVIVGATERIVVATQHFPLLSSLSDMTTRNIDFVILLVISLTIVSTRIAWRRRLVLFGSALAVVLVIQIVASVLTVKMMAAQEMESKQKILVMLPWEFRIVDRLKYLLYDFGQPAIMFALLFATLTWNVGFALTPPPRPRPARSPTPVRARKSRRALVGGVSLVAATVSILGWTVWRTARESDARHVQAHARLGHLFLMNGDRTTAEEQYRIAVADGTTDAGVFYNLGRIAVSRGRFDESRRLFQRAADLATDPALKRRVEQALHPDGGTRPEPPPVPTPGAAPPSPPADATGIPSR